MFYDGKHVLVTGGTGFVGTHIVQELLKYKTQIRIPIHKRQPLVTGENIETIEADLTSPEDCLRAVRDVDFVFHAAGAVSGAGATTGNPMSSITTNLILTVRMLEAACVSGVKRFLIFSSSTGYPVKEHPVKEEEFWAGPTHTSYFGYGWMRRYLERIAEFVVSKSDMKIAVVRPTAIYGRFDNFDLATSHVVPALICKAVKRSDPYEVWGNGEEVRDFLHVRDLARGCLLMLEKHAVCDAVNIGYGKVVTIREIVQLILEAADYKDAKVVFNTSKPTAIPFRMVDTTKGKSILGFEPEISLKEGLHDTITWFKQMANN
jgi:GDP-L-fucose synthase